MVIGLSLPTNTLPSSLPTKLGLSLPTSTLPSPLLTKLLALGSYRFSLCLLIVQVCMRV